MTVKISILDKTAMIGMVRERLPQGTKIFPTVAPFEEVASTKVLVDILLEAGATLAPLRAAGAEAELRGRDMYSQAILTLADIAIKEEFKEEDLRILREAGELNLQPNNFIAMQRRQAESKIRQGLERCRDDVDNRLEWLTINALLGEIAYTSDRINFTLDTQIPTAQKDQAPSTYWEAEGAEPFDDLIDWCETVYDGTGIRPRRMIAPAYVFLHASRNATFRSTVGNVGKIFFSPEQAKQAILANTPIEEIVEYDASYVTVSQNLAGVRSQTNNRFLNRGKIILCPKDGDVEGGLIRNLTAPAMQNGWNAGYYPINVDHTKEDPPQIEVGAGINAIPFLKHPKTVFTATVITPS